MKRCLHRINRTTTTTTTTTTTENNGEINTKTETIKESIPIRKEFQPPIQRIQREKGGVVKKEIKPVLRQRKRRTSHLVL